MDRIINESIRGTAQRGETETCAEEGGWICWMFILLTRKEGIPQRKFVDVVKKDTKRATVTEEDAGTGWWRKMTC